MHKSLQSTVWVWSFSSVTLFHLCMIYPTSLLFLQLCPCSDSDYNLIYTLKVKICGYKYSAKYLKNPKASVRTISPPYVWYSTSSLKTQMFSCMAYLLCVTLCFGFGFPPFSLLLQDMSDFKGLFFHVLHPQDHLSQQLVLRPKSIRSCALSWTTEISLRSQMKIHSFRSRTKKSNPSGPKKLSIEFLNYVRFWWPCSKSSSPERYSMNRTNRVTGLECFCCSEGQNSERAKRMTAKERSNSKRKTIQKNQQTTKTNPNKFNVFVIMFCEAVKQICGKGCSFCITIPSVDASNSIINQWFSPPLYS